MAEACRNIIAFSDVPKRIYDVSAEKQSAIIHQFLILGEAAARLPDEFKDAHESVPWHQLTGMRNLLIHDYISVDVDIVWQTAVADIPGLLAKLEKLLAYYCAGQG